MQAEELAFWVKKVHGIPYAFTLLLCENSVWFIQVGAADVHSHLRTGHHLGDVWRRKDYQYARVTAFSSVASHIEYTARLKIAA